MDLAWSNVAFTSVAGSLLLVRLTPQYTPGASYIATFCLLLLLQILGFVIWQAVLWPRFFSPLRHLPEPKVLPPLIA